MLSTAIASAAELAKVVSITHEGLTVPPPRAPAAAVWASSL
jgi:hypothetical protein